MQRVAEDGEPNLDSLTEKQMGGDSGILPEAPEPQADW